MFKFGTTVAILSGTNGHVYKYTKVTIIMHGRPVELLIRLDCHEIADAIIVVRGEIYGLTCNSGNDRFDHGYSDVHL